MNFLRIDQAKERREPLAAVAPIVNSLLKLDNASRHMNDCGENLIYVLLWQKKVSHLRNTQCCTN